jgi:hypothetical protein
MNSADEPLDATDTRILAAVGELYTAADPVPADLALEISFQLSVRALHAEVAELQRPGPESGGADAAEPPDADRGLVGAVRDDQVTRTETLTFSCDQLSAMVTVTALDEDTVRIDGWLTAPDCAVELRMLDHQPDAPSQVTRTRADEDGRFTLARIKRGLAQLVFRDGDRRPVVTPYVEL